MANDLVLSHPNVNRASGIPRYLLLLAGWAALLLGMIGVIMPVLPTAPFLLLAVACFSRSSPGMVRRLYGLPLAGKYLHDWQEGGVTPAMKWAAIGALWLAALAALLTVAKTVLLKTAVVFVTLLTTLHFVLLPVRRRRAARDS